MSACMRFALGLSVGADSANLFPPLSVASENGKRSGFRSPSFLTFFFTAGWFRFVSFYLCSFKDLTSNAKGKYI